MIITKLTAKNFGKHETISFETRDSVVGIIGPNGSGKSTLLKLLQFLFTGILEDNLDSYVRTGSKFCEGEAHFIKNGQPGRIYRKVFAGSSPAKRELEWNGSTTIRDSEVASRLAEILGADKHAINNAVFIPQGDLDKILFGDQAEREKLFTRLVNVAFLEKTVGVIDARIKQESANTEDLTAVVDELRVQLAQAGGNVQDIDLEYRAKGDSGPELAARRRMLDVLQQEEQSRSRVAAAGQAAQQHKTALRAALTSEGYISWEALQVHETTLLGELKTWQTRHDVLVRGKHAKEMHERTVQDIRQLEHTLAEQNARHQQTVERLSGTDLPVLRDLVIKAEFRETLAPTLAKTQAAMTAALEAYTSQQKTGCPDDSRLEPLKQEISALNSAVGGLDLSLRTLRSVVGRSVGDRCPCCNQTIDPAVLGMERLEKLELERATLWTSLQAKNREVETTEKARRDWTVKTKALSDEYLRQVKLCGEVTEQLRLLPQNDATALRAQYNQLLEQQAARQELEVAIRNSETTLALKRSFQLSAADSNAIQEFSPEQLTAVEEKLRQAQAEQQRLINLRSTISSLWQAMTKAEAEAQASELQLSKVLASLEEARGQTCAYPPIMDDALPARVAELEGLERARQECAGRLQQARQTLAALQKRDLELAERLHKNAVRMQVVEDLRRLRETFSRGGLPMIYVEYQFRRLTTLAQSNLSNIGANFTVDVNETRPVAFTFSRMDDEAGQGLDMVKLSGGQRVKLSIAFLLAVQQLLIPEVGLLVLDEPSTHLDEESVGALKNLLMSMTQTLQNANHQVWVVDHHTDLMPAFGTCLQLS